MTDNAEWRKMVNDRKWEITENKDKIQYKIMDN